MLCENCLAINKVYLFIFLSFLFRCKLTDTILYNYSKKLKECQPKTVYMIPSYNFNKKTDLTTWKHCVI